MYVLVIITKKPIGKKLPIRMTQSLEFTNLYAE
jgi:hypothetical protein